MACGSKCLTELLQLPASKSCYLHLGDRRHLANENFSALEPVALSLWLLTEKQQQWKRKCLNAMTYIADDNSAVSTTNQ